VEMVRNRRPVLKAVAGAAQQISQRRCSSSAPGRS
jgi:hypothetical protein